MNNFFFDTADITNLKRVWNDLKGEISSNQIVGITTNPAIFQRANKNSLQEWFDTLVELDAFLSQLSASPELHVQFPSSTGSASELLKFVDKLESLKLTSVLAIKLPPFDHLLSAAEDIWQHYINITGLSEAGTLLKLPEWVSYASLIPGRMLSAGLEYKDHLVFAERHSHCTVITGALRDFEQVATCIKYGSTPTIGLKTWDLIVANREVEKLAAVQPVDLACPEFMPEVTSAHTALSKSFFSEMDAYGAQAYQNLKDL